MWTVYDKNGIDERCSIHKLEYYGEYMSERYISATIKSNIPIEFKIGDYFIYRGEQFTINYDPSVIKKGNQGTTGDAFTYENIKFNSYSDELTRCQFLDYVLSGNNIHFSSLPNFSFYAGTIQALADRIQANLDRVYTGDEAWTITVTPEYSGKTNILIPVNNYNIWQALALVQSMFSSNFVIRGRTVTIGTSGIAIDNVFRYGKGNGLNKITRVADDGQQIITRLRVYGSTRNLPNRYYNKLTNTSSGNYLPDNMAVTNLMLPSFPYDTLDPYLDSPNISELGVREGSVFFDGSDTTLEEIYPSMEGITAQDLINAGITISIDSGDNGNLDEISIGSKNTDGSEITDNGIYEDGATVPPFIVTLKDLGFNPWDYKTSGTNPSISMKNGMCGGREFEIKSCVKSGNKYILTCNRVQDSGLGLYFPYKDFKISAVDKFVLLNIDMPDVYVKAASQRLLTAGQTYRSKNDYVRYTYTLSISSVYMARNPLLYENIYEGDLMLFTDTDLGIDGSIFIDSLRIKEGEDIIPIYEVTLNEDKVVGTIEKIQNQIDSISNGQGLGGYTAQQINSLIKTYGRNYFLSRLNDDTASGQITFKSGIVVQADSVNTVSAGLMETSDAESATVSGGVMETTSEEEASGTTLGSLTNVNPEVDALSPYDMLFGRKAGSEKYSSIMLKDIRPTSSAIVNTYQEMIDLEVSSGLLIVLVTSDTKNNNGNPSEYRKYANGITMWQASININQL